MKEFINDGKYFESFYASVLSKELEKCSLSIEIIDWT